VRLRLKSDESGFTLIEVLVSAMLVATIAIGILAGIDSSSALSGNLRNRGEAGSIAQGEQERLRSLKASDLDAVALSSPPGALTAPQYQPASPTIRGQTYTVKSWVWKVDQAGTASACAGSSPANHYLRIRTQVTWVGQPSGIPPARQESVVPLPPGGTGALVVTIKDAQATPANVGGVTVSVDGGSPQTTTAANGCVEWDTLAPGSHTVTFSKAGYVTPDGQANVSRVVSVSDASTSYANFTFDKGASVTAVPFYFMNGATRYTAPTGTPGVGFDQVTLTNTNSYFSSPQTYGTAGDYEATIDLPNLMGFSTSYGLYPSTCAAMNQTTLGLAAWTLSWTSPNGPFTQSDANGIRLLGYKLNWQYKWGGPGQNTPAVGARVYFYRQADSCPKMTFGPFTGLSTTAPFVASGFAASPFGALPPGVYKHCGEYDDTDPTRNPGLWMKNVTSTFTLNSADLTSPQTNSNQVISSTGASPTPGPCPATE
jgi:Tfp pilus assembly protein PilV